MTAVRGSTNKGSGYRTDTCEKCGGPLRASDGHFHTAVDWARLPLEVCCKCAGHEGSAPQVAFRTSLKVTDKSREFAPAVVESAVQKTVEEVRLEEDILTAALRLGQFSISKLWEAVSPERKDSIWYDVRDALQQHPELYEQVSKRVWRVK